MEWRWRFAHTEVGTGKGRKEGREGGKGWREGGPLTLLHRERRERSREGVIYGARCSPKGRLAAALKQQHSNGLEECVSLGKERRARSSSHLISSTLMVGGGKELSPRRLSP